MDQRSDEFTTTFDVQIHSDLEVVPAQPRGRSDASVPAPPHLRVVRTRRVDVGAAAALTAVAALVYGWQVQRPGAWMDETATIAACRRSLAELVRLVGNVDLVHFGYYLVARTVWQLDPSLTAVRLISVVAMSLTCGLLVLIGRRLGSLPVGVVAGLLMVLSPHASRFAQEARSVALVALVTTALTWYLIGRLPDPGPNDRRGPRVAAAGYAGGLLLLGVLNLLAVLIVVPHAVVAWALGRSRAWFSWIAGAAAGLVLLVPFALADLSQRSQVYWIQEPTLYDVKNLVVQQFGGTFGGTLLVALAVLVLLAVGGRRPLEPPVRAALVVGAGWAVLPPALLLAVSTIHPTYDLRYVFFAVPGTYLAVAALLVHVRLDLLRPPPALAPALVLALLVAVGLGTQQQIRGPLGHTEDTAAVARYLAAQAKPGDAFVLVPTELRIIVEANPASFQQLNDIALVVDPKASGTLDGRVIGADQVRGVVLPYARLWLITGYYQPESLYSDTEVSTLSTIRQWYRPVQDRRIGDIGVSLVVR